MTRRTRTLLVACGLAVVLLGVGMLLPVPYVTLLPGPVTDTLGSVGGKPLIQVEGRRTYPTS
ncbi:MAG TPA: signal protein PDZ, partial [Frankiaceae bacterium]|nr:signal protein PDZ [Frankiaceae bacterium]